MVAARMLEKQGFRVERATNGREALEALEAEDYGVVLMVIFSGDEAREVVLELLGAGAIAYVRKGVTGAEITKTLADALKAKADQPV